MAVQIGTPLIWGTHYQPKPISNIPPSATKIKIRLRERGVAVAFVYFSDRIEQWTLGPKTTYSGPYWILRTLQRVNYRLFRVPRSAFRI